LVDIRPRYFSKTLGTTGAVSSLLILLSWSYVPEYFAYSLFAAFIIQCLAFLYLHSIAQQKLEGSRWHQNLKEWKKKEKEKAKRRQKEMDNFFK
jgi:hypothetical protein